MDAFISRLASRKDGELELCLEHGIAYQRDQSSLIDYGAEYFNKCAGYEGQDIANAINRGRVELVAKHYCPVSNVLDIGIGSGEFIKKRPNTWGYDINQTAALWLKKNSLWSNSIMAFDAFTMWDVIEHVPTPADYFNKMPIGAWLFTSIPIFHDLTRIRESKHYRPDEHLYHFTESGFIAWMRMHGFDTHAVEDFETRAGRESIRSFALRKSDGA